MLENCGICYELNNSSKSNLSRLLVNRKINNAVLSCSENFAIIPSIGPLVVGHCLMIPKIHTNSIFSLESNHNCFNEIKNMLAKYNSKFNHDNDKILFCFEHGSLYSINVRTLCSTVHAHLHVLPLENVTAESIMGDVLKAKSVTKF